jgi:hypothetical protein
MSSWPVLNADIQTNRRTEQYGVKEQTQPFRDSDDVANANRRGEQASILALCWQLALVAEVSVQSPMPSNGTSKQVGLRRAALEYAP